jgi:opacity protein-like surface antigen
MGEYGCKESLRIASRARDILCSVAVWALAMGPPAASAQPAEPSTTNAVSTQSIIAFDSSPSGIWANGIGEGFRPASQSIGLEAGAVGGVAAFGSQQAHDLSYFGLSYGHMLGGVRGLDHWYRGNLEIRAELFGGQQISPQNNWLVGLTPHLRYDFATGTRWVPFIDVGAGITETGIRAPDLGGAFEFNIQGGVGIQCFLRNNLAIGVEGRYLHVSCAGLHEPNLGVNGAAGLVGMNYYF